ncbi:hypothetical protein J4225_02420 [Candidatus Pacearchaeota archaeon]|nr:hypothetical protein [Candidatus Pacearchaeota archaeon]
MKDKIKEQKPKICLTTFFDKNFEHIGKICLKGMRRYAEKYGYDIIAYTKPLTTRPPAWNKIAIIRQLLNSQKDYDFVFWVDSDTIFMRFDKDIAKEISPNKDVYLTKFNAQGQDRPSTGVMLICNSNWSKQLLQVIWNKKQYIYNKLWENAALDDVLGYKHIIDRKPFKEFLLGIAHKLKIRNYIPKLKKMLSFKKLGFTQKSKNKLGFKNINKKIINNPKSKWLEKVKWLDSKWNALCYEPLPRNRIINHYPAMSIQERLKQMVADVKLVNTFYF